MKKLRQPIVTVLGHVDHGKTTLLDALRNTLVQKGEAGGITQSIGASVFETQEGKKITFLDTPGHAAFSNMRSRGSKIADIALLILDASDGVKPQTKEAFEYINLASIPYIVVITKTDLPTASVETRLQELEKEGILFEGRGGQTPYLTVSAKEKKGLKELIDLILLFSEINNISSDDEKEFEAFVIETDKDKAGISTSIVVKEGILVTGEEIYSEDVSGKARAIFDTHGTKIDKVLPGEPAKIIGFEDLPQAGSQVKKGKVEINRNSKNAHIKNFDKNKIPLILKASTAGALEALIASIPSDFSVVSSSVGDVNESDVLNAKANNATIMAFESKISTSVSKLAEMDGVKLSSHKIIYEILQILDDIVKKGRVEILGKAEIIAEFPFNGKRVAGCKVIQGIISKTSRLSLTRKGLEIGTIKAVSIKKQKIEVAEVKQSEEFGILFYPALDFQKGDMILSVKS